MSCNTKTSLAAVIDAVNAQLNNNYVDRDDPRINQGVFTEPTIRGGLMLDEAAKLDFCGYVTECGQREPFGKQWVDRPLYPYNTLVSYEDEGEIKSRWQDIDDVVAGTEIGESYTTYEETRSLGLQGYTIIDSFELGATITQRDQALRDAATGKLYRWAGDLPKIVPAGSTPVSSGGIDTNAWLEVSDTALRQEILTGGLLNDAVIKTVGGVERTLQSKNSDTINVKDFGAKGDGVTDDTAAIQAAIDSGKPIHLGEGVYRITETIKTKSFTYLHGLGNASVIKADNVVGAAILTYSGAGEATASNQNVGNFCVVGTADCAVAFAHCTVSVFSNIHLSATASGSRLTFAGRYGFVFEYFWGSSFESLFTNGSGISKSCFKFNRVILASTFNMLYTSNVSEYSFEISADNEYGTGTASGHHTNIINMAVAQGATKYGMLVRGGTGFVHSKFYTEACVGSLHIKSGIRHTFNDCNFSGLKAASTHSIYIDNEKVPTTYLSNITFNDCEFEPTRAIVIGSTTAGVAIFNPRSFSELPIFPLIKRNANTPVAMNLTVHEKAGSSPQTMYEKSRNNGHKFAATYLDIKVVEGVEVSYWKDMPVVIPELTDITPY